MKKLLVLAVVVLLTAGAALAGDGKSCNREAKNVQLTGVIDGQTFRVADQTAEYTICDESKANLASLKGAKVKITGKLVNCKEGRELFIEKASKI